MSRGDRRARRLVKADAHRSRGPVSDGKHPNRRCDSRRTHSDKTGSCPCGFVPHVLRTVAGPERETVISLPRNRGRSGRHPALVGNLEWLTNFLGEAQAVLGYAVHSAHHGQRSERHLDRPAHTRIGPYERAVGVPPPRAGGATDLAPSAQLLSGARSSRRRRRTTNPVVPINIVVPPTSRT